jgi:hypothetical protein
MSVTVSTFRDAFPEFKDAALYTDPGIQFWLDLTTNLLDINRWGALFDAGSQLFVAHNLSLQYVANQKAAVGDNPGQIEGPVSSGSVDKVSYSRDNGAAMDPSNGHWNLSSYGLRYIQLARMIGMGPVQVGAYAADTSQSAAAWAGPGLNYY